MLDTTMMLISDAPAIIEAVGSVSRSVENLKLSVLPRIESAYGYEAWDDVALVLIHQSKSGPTTEIGRLLRLISAARRPVAAIVLGPKHDNDQVLNLFRLGVADYLELPLDLSRLAYLIEILTIRVRHAGPGTAMAAAQDVPAGLECSAEIFDDEGPAMARLMGQVQRVAPQETTILLGGETGTGKTRLAQIIHQLSRRRDEPFLKVNCGTLSAGLIESEMFGHVRGAFPGADSDRVGKFAEVGGGTLFLDEIDLLPLSLQTKLLRAVEDRMFEPVGSNRTVPIRGRLIAASNRSLDEEVAAQRFRSDLYYRLNVVGFLIPPLRNRREAIPTLTARFLAEFAAKCGRNVTGITQDALRVLMDQDWPGNIRELRNVLEQAVTLSSGPQITVEDLPAPISQPATWANILATRDASTSRTSRTTLAQIKGEAELARITEALEKHSNNRLRAASELGISRMTLYKKLYKYGLMQSDGLSQGGVV